jgi:hypothetical protein
MKTTVELADDLLRAAKVLAAKERRTLRALLEEGLRWVLGRRRRQRSFRLRNGSVRGRGVQPGVVEGNWEAVRDSIYKGRGS